MLKIKRLKIKTSTKSNKNTIKCIFSCRINICDIYLYQKPTYKCWIAPNLARTKKRIVAPKSLSFFIFYKRFVLRKLYSKLCISTSF